MDISAVLSWFRSFLWAFHGFPLCFRCFLTVFCGFRCIEDIQSRSFIPIPLVSVEFPAVFHCFRSLFAVFCGISSCFGCYPVCSRCFLWVSDVFRPRLLPPIAQSARCACQKPKDTANPFTNTPRFGLLTLLGTNFDTTFLDGISIGRYLASCIPQNPCHSKRFPKLRSI